MADVQDESKPEIADEPAMTGAGGTSMIFSTQDGGKEYLVKRLRTEYVADDRYHELFRKEYEIGRAIDHPNIVKYMRFEDNGTTNCRITMENVVGETLARFIDSHPDYFASRRHLDKFFNQLLSALNCLHQNHVVFSDLSPNNILITQVNHDVKIIDLGFCFSDSYTRSVGMTECFSAPEHQERGIIDVTTDIYCVGKIIEYIGKSTSHNLPAVYSKIMLRCLKHRKQDRIQTTDEIIRMINKRRHVARRVITTALICVAMFIVGKSLSYNERVLAWWDSFELFPANVEYDIEYRYIYYSILSEEDMTCQAVGCINNPNVYLHPEVEIKGRTYKLTHIADSAFRYKSYVKSVYIPEGVKTIGTEAFRECKNLAVVNIPNSVVEVEDYAFYACENIYSLRLSERLTEIATAAFCGSKIKKVEIPEGVTRIKLDAFGNCLELEEVILPETLQAIERGAFYNCPSLREITIPARVTKIGEFQFFECTSLTDIYNYAPEPQVLTPIHRNPKQITLHVPADAIEKYRKADYWKEMQIVAL